MRDALRTCLQIAGGLTEATRRRAVGAARELLDQAGIDVEEVQRSIGRRIPTEVQTLADELMTAGRANRDLLVGLIREEIDKAMTRVSRLADDVTRVGVVLEALERRIRNLEGDGRVKAAADASGTADTEDEGGEAEPGLYVPPQPPVEHVPVEGEPPVKSAAPTARKNAAPATAPATPKKAAAPSRTPVAAPTARKNAAPGAVPAVPKSKTPAAAPAKKAAAKKAAPAKKSAAVTKTASAAKGTPAKTTAAEETAAPRKAAKAAPSARTAAPVKKAAARKTAPAAKTATAAKAPAKKATPERSATANTAAKKATAKKTTAKKTTAKKTAAKKTTGTREASRD